MSIYMTPKHAKKDNIWSPGSQFYIVFTAMSGIISSDSESLIVAFDLPESLQTPTYRLKIWIIRENMESKRITKPLDITKSVIIIEYNVREQEGGGVV